MQSYVVSKLRSNSNLGLFKLLYWISAMKPAKHYEVMLLQIKHKE